MLPPETKSTAPRSRPPLKGTEQDILEPVSDSPNSLDQLIEFPTSFTFRAVAATLPGLPQACAAAVEQALGRPVEELTEQPSSKGKWTSVRVTIEVQNADEVLSGYSALKAVDGVKMTL